MVKRRNKKMVFGSNGMSNHEAKNHFEQNFEKAGINDEEMYYPGMCINYGGTPESCKNKLLEAGKTISKAPSMEGTTGGTFTDYALLPAWIDPSIVDRTIRETPLVKLLPRRAVKSLTYVYNILSAKAGAAFLDEDAPLSEQVDTRTNGTVSMKYLYAVGRVTGPALTGGMLLNLQSEDFRTKMASMNEALENEIINGNTSTNANGFQGLIQSITTNTTDASGAEITLQNIRDDVNTSFEANGLIDLCVTDGRTFGYIKGLLMDYQKNIEKPSPEMSFGIPDAFMIDGVLFIKDRYMPTTAASRRILFLDTRYVFLAVLQDYTVVQMGINNDSNKYFIKWYGSLVVNFESAMVQRYGLA